jgi:hypothetical protein
VQYKALPVFAVIFLPPHRFIRIHFLVCAAKPLRDVAAHVDIESKMWKRFITSQFQALKP